MKQLTSFILASFFLLACTKEQEPISVNFSFSPSSAEVDNQIQFTNTSTNAQTYKWDFGDGTTSTEKNPTHSYTTSGTKTVKLTGTSGTSVGYQSKTITITAKTVTEVIPVANFTTSTSTATTGQVITFTNTSTNAHTYTWNFGDNTTSTLENPTHSYATAGLKMVTLTARNNNGKTHSCTKMVLISVPEVIDATFTFQPSPIKINTKIYFTPTALGTYAWDFGDGSTSTSMIADHTFTKFGKKAIKLTVTGTTGAKNSTTQTVAIYPNNTRILVNLTKYNTATTWDIGGYPDLIFKIYNAEGSLLYTSNELANVAPTTSRSFNQATIPNVTSKLTLKLYDEDLLNSRELMGTFEIDLPSIIESLPSETIPTSTIQLTNNSNNLTVGLGFE